jgi:hypothetical protein
MINGFFPEFLSKMSSSPQGEKQVLQGYTLRPYWGCHRIPSSFLGAHQAEDVSPLIALPILRLLLHNAKS